MTTDKSLLDELERLEKDAYEGELLLAVMDAFPRLLELARKGLEKEWMPIESAPKDGTSILAMIPYSAGARWEIMWWDKDRSRRKGTQWRYLANKCVPVLPTHWQSLPQPPKGEV